MKSVIGIAVFVTFISLPCVASTGVIKANQVWVLSRPDSKSEILLKIDQGTKVKILLQRGAWLKIRVQLDPTYGFDGWVSERMVKWKKPKIARKTKRKRKRVVKPPPPPRPKPKRTPTPQKRIVRARTPTPKPKTVRKKVVPKKTVPKKRALRNDILNKFFEPASLPTVDPVEKPKPKARKKRPTSKRRVASVPRDLPKEKSTRKVKPRQTFQGGTSKDRARVSLGLGYLIYQYTLKTGGTDPGEILSYSLPGFAFDLSSNFWFWEKSDNSLRLGSSLDFQYVLYSIDTSLRDADGVDFGSKKANNFSYDILLRLLSEYRFYPRVRTPALGVSLGFEYFQFKGDDVESDGGPILVYVSQRTMSVLVGMYGQMPIGRDFMGKISLDILPFNFLKEDPSGATGIDAKAGTGFTPKFSLLWAPSERSYLEFGYKLRFQTYSFDGTSTRFGSEVVGGSADNIVHGVFVNYGYHF